MKRLLKQAFQHLLSQQVPHGLGRIRHRLLSGLGHSPILVYTMGKVGSSTVVATLRQNRISSLVYHVHFLSSAELDRIQAKYENADKSAATGVSLGELFSGDLNHLASSRILSGIDLRDTFVISLVRDPIDTFLSHVFQNPAIHRPFLLHEDGSISKTAVQEYVSDHFLSFVADDDYISNWFDEEFRSFSGIDVYDHPFDRNTGYSIIREGQWNIAIVALEHLSEGLTAALTELPGKEANISIERRNTRADTTDRDLYNEIKDSLSIPVECLQKVYATRYAQHFFSPEHHRRALEKWCR